MKKKIITICIVIVLLIMSTLTILNYKRIKGYFFFGFETCNGSCSSINNEELKEKGEKWLRCPICFKKTSNCTRYDNLL